MVGEAKSWRDAQLHCRNLRSDLVSVHSAETNEAALTASVSQKVWIGLFKDPWRWSDGSPASFRYWKPSQPNYLEGQDCVAAVLSDQGKWNDMQCRRRRHFVCHGGEFLSPPDLESGTILISWGEFLLPSKEIRHNHHSWGQQPGAHQHNPEHYSGRDMDSPDHLGLHKRLV